MRNTMKQIEKNYKKIHDLYCGGVGVENGANMCSSICGGVGVENGANMCSSICSLFLS